MHTVLMTHGEYRFQDLETFDLEDFKYNSVNMTSYRIVDDENHRVANVLREMERFQRVGQNMLHKSGIIRVIGGARRVIIVYVLYCFENRFGPKSFAGIFAARFPSGSPGARTRVVRVVPGKTNGN